MTRQRAQLMMLCVQMAIAVLGTSLLVATDSFDLPNFLFLVVGTAVLGDLTRMVVHRADRLDETPRQSLDSARDLGLLTGVYGTLLVLTLGFLTITSSGHDGRLVASLGVAAAFLAYRLAACVYDLFHKRT